LRTTRRRIDGATDSSSLASAPSILMRNERLRASRWIDAALFTMVLVIAGWWGQFSIRASTVAGRLPLFYNALFEPALMTACGRGFQVAVEQPVAVQRFLSLADDRFSCASLPPALVMRTDRPEQGAWLYLMLMVAAAWKILGISWTGLAPLFGLLFGLTCAWAYVIFRFGMVRWLAIACAAAIALSSLHVLNLPNLRDYAKAPFMLALVAVAMTLGLRPMKAVSVVALCAGYGALVGIGYGLKPDTLIQLPLLAATLLFFLPGPWRATSGVKAGALAAGIAACAVAMWPVIRATPSTGSNLWHVALIGLMPEYGTALGVEQPNYHFGVTGSDEFVYLAVNSYARRIHADWAPPAQMASAEYEAATRAYLREFLPRFPADMVTRTIASIARMPELPFGWPDPPLPGVLDSLYAIRARVLRPLYGYGLAITLAALAGVIVARPHEGVFLTFLFAYLGAYPVIQFHNRNFFYLEFIGWLAIGFVVTSIVAMIRDPGSVRALTARVAATRIVAAVAVVAGSFVVLIALRAYQGRLLRPTIGGYLRAAFAAVALDRTDHDGAHVAALASGPSARDDWARLLRVELDPRACGPETTITFQYDRNSRYRGLTSTVPIAAGHDAGAGRIILFEPVYSGFASVDLRGAGGDCLHAVDEVTGLDVEPLWLPLVLDPDWRRLPLHQALHTRENIH
jgi:hypothetical protein